MLFLINLKGSLANLSDARVCQICIFFLVCLLCYSYVVFHEYRTLEVDKFTFSTLFRREAGKNKVAQITVFLNIFFTNCRV